MTQTAITTWNLDPAHSVAEFKVKHMMISNVKGQFAKVTGVLTLDESDLTKSSVEASIDVDSIGTNDAQRDGHLEECGFLRCGEVSGDDLQIDEREGCKQRRRHGRGRSDDQRRYAEGRVFSGRADSAGQGPVGQSAGGGFGDDEDQPQRLRPDLECCARDGWRAGGR